MMAVERPTFLRMSSYLGVRAESRDVSGPPDLSVSGPDREEARPEADCTKPSPRRGMPPGFSPPAMPPSCDALTLRRQGETRVVTSWWLVQATAIYCQSHVVTDHACTPQLASHSAHSCSNQGIIQVVPGPTQRLDGRHCVSDSSVAAICGGETCGCICWRLRPSGPFPLHQHNLQATAAVLLRCDPVNMHPLNDTIPQLCA